MSKSTDRRKILLVGAGLSGGGGERHFNMIAKWLYGGTADVLLTTRPGVKCYRNAIFPLQKDAVITYSGALHRCCGRGYDAIIGVSRYAAFTAWWIQRTVCRSIPLILMDISVFLRAHNVDSRWFKSAPLLGCRWAYSQADLLLANSTSGAADLITLTRGQTKVLRMPNLIDPDWVKSGSCGPWPASIEAGPYILALGRLVITKRLDSAIRAFAQISSQIPHRFVIAGAGPEQVNLAELADTLGVGHRVVFCGWVNDPLSLLSRAEALIHTSTVEGYPNAILEAMALHIPVISGDWGLDARSLANKGALLLVQSDDPDSIVQALRIVLTLRDTRIRLIKAADFSIVEHLVPQAIAPYESAISAVIMKKS